MAKAGLQCDVWRELRLPGLLVGDARLGGISATISAYETLLIRGFDIVSVVLLDNIGKDSGLEDAADLHNSEALKQHFGKEVPVMSLPAIRPSHSTSKWVRPGPCPSSADLEVWPGQGCNLNYIIDSGQNTA